MDRERIIPIVAIVVLLVGSLSTIYVHGTVESSDDKITINGHSYTVNYIFSIVEQRTVVTNDGSFSGIALDDLLEKTGTKCISCHTYTITGKDGYSKTVTWKNLQNGILTKERKVVFSDLPKAFRVRDVVSIEVS